MHGFGLVLAVVLPSHSATAIATCVRDYVFVVYCVWYMHYICTYAAWNRRRKRMTML